MLVNNLDIIQLTLNGTMQSQDVRNVYQYEVLHSAPGALDISDIIPLWFINFDTSVLYALHTTMKYTGVSGVNLNNTVQIYEAGVDATGDQTGDSLPVHDTISVKLIRSSGITRNGRKSFSGISEGLTNNGDLTLNQTFIDSIELFHHESADYDDLQSPVNTVTFRPVIVGRTKDVNGVYQLDLSKVNTIRAAQVSSKVRTQNTRKP